MDQTNDRGRTERPPLTEEPRVPTPGKRFRVEKIEERIAPKKGSGSSASGSFDLTSSSSMSY